MHQCKRYFKTHKYNATRWLFNIWPFPVMKITTLESYSRPISFQYIVICFCKVFSKLQQQIPTLYSHNNNYVTKYCCNSGLVVMGGDSSSQGRWFESQRHILDEHFFTLICCKSVLMFVWKRPKINKKEAGDSPFKN